MPAHHLTAAPADELITAVLQVVAGADPAGHAAAVGLDPADLADAAHTYHAAGLAALAQRADEPWYQLRVQFPDWDTAERAAHHLGPALERLEQTGALTGWWFLRKHPCWRLRLRDADRTAVHQALGRLTAAGAIVRWWPTVYEPETAAFGGPAGIGIAHDLFCADSHAVLRYLDERQPGVPRRELSLLLIGALLHTAGLDWFERGDVFARVASLRPPPTGVDGDERITALTGNVRALLAAPPDPHGELFGPGGPTAAAAAWLNAFTDAGRRLGDAATGGLLDRGLRAIITHLVIFHWNRLGLSATTQGLLAHAATTALLPPN
jgi:thiopeptide-type bacteriocin biosynthesis protein